MPQNISQTALLSFVAYFLALVLVRFVGRKSVSQLTFFDLVLGVSFGTIVASIALGPNRYGAIAVLVLFALFTVLLDYLHIDSFKLRKMINSEPVVVIKNGQIVEGNMRKIRLTLENLNMQLREKNIFNISDVEFAIAETDGMLSVLPKSQKQPLTPADLGLSTSYQGLTRDVIIDGHVMSENLKDAHLDLNWLSDRLQRLGIANAGEVFYAGLDTAGNMYVSQKRRTGETAGKYGIE